MVLTVSLNTQYGGPLVNQKYKPLDIVEPIPTSTQSFFSRILENRCALIENTYGFTGDVKLYMDNWAAAIAREHTRATAPAHGAVQCRPPLVVISSNRSDWISKGFDSGLARAHLIGKQGNIFDGPSDFEALSKRDEKSVTPPIYAPTRFIPPERQGGWGRPVNRTVYVVVHKAEYATYKTALQSYPNVEVVGFRLGRRDVAGQTPPGPTGQAATLKLYLAGFGASRYAAIAFCKHMRESIGAQPGNSRVWDWAWLLDDNVVAIGGGFPNFEVLEDSLPAAAQGPIAVGFKGGTLAGDPADHRKMADDWERSGRQPSTSVTAHDTDQGGPIQQVALWNIERMHTDHLNFSPVFVNSAEDTSMLEVIRHASGTGGGAAGARRYSYRFFGGYTVSKESTSYDLGSTISKRQSQQQLTTDDHRDYLTKLMVQSEKTTPSAQPTPPAPPPIAVHDTSGTEMTLNAMCLSDADRTVKRTEHFVRPLMKKSSQGAEQLMEYGLKNQLVQPNAVQRAFFRAGNVTQRDR